jgi:hypothetical protein
MGWLENDDHRTLKAGIDSDELVLSHVPTSVFPGDDIWDPADERKKKAGATHTKAHFFWGRKDGPKSPDYEDQKFEIAICKHLVW